MQAAKSRRKLRHGVAHLRGGGEHHLRRDQDSFDLLLLQVDVEGSVLAAVRDETLFVCQVVVTASSCVKDCQCFPSLSNVDFSARTELTRSTVL